MSESNLRSKMSSLDVKKTKKVSPTQSNSSNNSVIDRQNDLDERIQKVDDLQTRLRRDEQQLDNDAIENIKDSDSFGYGGDNYFNRDDIENFSNYDNYGYNYENYGQTDEQQNSFNEMTDDTTLNNSNNVQTNGNVRQLNDNLMVEDLDSTSNISVNNGSAKNLKINSPKNENRRSSESYSPFSGFLSTFRGKFGAKKVDTIQGSRGPIRMNAFEESDEKSGCFKMCF